ncbi:MAG: hypothetical protein RLY19_1053 [Actinomycetota bacterium]
MKILSWVLVGALFGWWAAERAAENVRMLRKYGETFGEAHITDYEFTPHIAAFINGILSLALILRFDVSFVAASFAILFAFGTQLALIDLDTHLLPRDIVLTACLCAAPLLVLSARVDPRGSIIRMAIGALLMWGGLRVLQLASKGDLGSGDVRLGGLLGMYLGWMSYGALLVALVAASVIAGVYALTTVAGGKANRSTRFAFGPFLIVGAVLAVLR